MKYDDQCAPPPKITGKDTTLSSSARTISSVRTTNTESGKKSHKSRFVNIFGKSKSSKRDKHEDGLSARSLYSPGKSESAYSGSVFSENVSIVSSVTASNALRVLIVGGSVSGIYLTKYLERKCGSGVKITILEQNENILLKFGAFAAAMDPTLAPHLIIGNKNMFKYSHNEVIKSTATSITPEYVETQDGKTIYYDVLVIASGSRYSSPCEIVGKGSVETKENLKTYFKYLQTSKSLVIIGGGASGIELALRVVKENLLNKITLIHDESMILNEEYPESYRNKIQKKLENEGIELILNDKAKIESGKNYGYPIKGRWLETESGKMVFSDMQVDCTGPVGNSEFVKSLNNDLMKVVDEERGFIRVNRYLQVIGQTKIFAIGDCNNICGIKTIDRAKSQAETVSETIHNWQVQFAEGKSYLEENPQVWTIDSNEAYMSIKNNELDEVRKASSTNHRLLNEAISKKAPPEITTRKADNIKQIYKVIGVEFKNRSAF
ncbi:hypothetical protein BB558_005562 [Smittium angustum]|uniref:FAD/NAD(P)-binding domain-containing protein n=1 Tax=Smittium angustum TaxID=133377 RepID=A0A2U1J047_SMIAN|nr:hypothetical protein BB558_005562 [Smittium angustum]